MRALPCCAAAALALRSRPPPAASRVDSFNGRIAFSSVRTDPQAKEFDIFSMNADGSGVRRLTTNPETDRQPDWSPRRHGHRLLDRQARLAGELRGRADDGGRHAATCG